MTPPAGSPLATEYFDNAYAEATATRVDVIDGVASRADVALVAGGSISGRVLAPNGTPLASGGTLMVSPASDRSVRDTYAVAPDGTFTVTGLGPGSYVVSAVADGTLVTYWGSATTSPVDGAAATPVTVSAGGTVAGVSIRLAPGASVSGRVTEGGAAASGRVSVVDVSTGNPVGDTVIGATGSYTVGALPAGTYAVMATGSSGAARWYGTVGSWADSTFVVLGTTTVRTGVDIALPAAPVAGPTSVVQGHVTLPAGATTGLDSLGVWLEDADGVAYWAFSVNADGTFEVADVPAGTLSVHLRDSTQQLVLGTVTVTAPSTTVLEVQPVIGGSIAGSLQNEAGRPLANVEVSAVDTSGATTSTLSAADGTYSLTGLVAGQFRLHLGPNSPYAGTWVGGSQAAGSGTSVTVALGATTQVPTTTVVLGGSVTGTITAPPAAQGTEITVEAVTGTGQVVGSTTVYGTSAYQLGGLLPGSIKVRFSGPGLATWEWAPGRGRPRTSPSWPARPSTTSTPPSLPRRLPARHPSRAPLPHRGSQPRGPR